MLSSGDVVDLDLGVPDGGEAGFRHPAVVLTGQTILDQTPGVVQVVPITSRLRGFASEVDIEPDADNGLTVVSAAQCQHIRAVSVGRVAQTRGNVGPEVLIQLRETIALILDIR